MKDQAITAAAVQGSDKKQRCQNPACRKLKKQSDLQYGKFDAFEFPDFYCGKCIQRSSHNFRLVIIRRTR